MYIVNRTRTSSPGVLARSLLSTTRMPRLRLYRAMNPRPKGERLLNWRGRRRSDRAWQCRLGGRRPPALYVPRWRRREREAQQRRRSQHGGGHKARAVSAVYAGGSCRPKAEFPVRPIGAVCAMYGNFRSTKSAHRGTAAVQTSARSACRSCGTTCERTVAALFPVVRGATSPAVDILESRATRWSLDSIEPCWNVPPGGRSECADKFVRNATRWSPIGVTREARKQASRQPLSARQFGRQRCVRAAPVCADACRPTDHQAGAGI